MSLTTALSNALSGLNASTREAELISANVANAQTPGYTRRTAEVGALALGTQGAGVRVLGVTLVEDPGAIAARRRADAGLAAQTATLDAAERMTAAFGAPGEPGALAVRAAAFETALEGAANDPASDLRLADAAQQAVRYAEKITSLSTETQRMRMDADVEIADQVATVNRNLQRIEALNNQIRMVAMGGGDASALLDQRKSLIDEVNSILPIREQVRADGEVALYSANGATLLDGAAAALGFTATPTITQDMTLASGALSGLTLNGRPMSVGAPDGSGMADGGSLGALFALRDTAMPQQADRLDALAEDLVQRFQDPATDTTRAPGEAGLFTDDGAAYAPADRAGLAGRLAVNDAVVPAAGGDPARLRDGLGAATPAPVGDATILRQYEAAALARRTPDPAMGITGSGGIADFAAGVTGVAAGAEATAELDRATSAALATSLREREAATSGVDTDAELQRLLAVEQAYAANARVMRSVNEMINRLLEI